MTTQRLLTSEEISGTTVVSFIQENQSVDEVLIPMATDELLAISDSSQRIVLNLHNVDFFGSSFIETMFRVWKRLKAKEGAFAVCCLQPYCHEVLEVTNLIDLWGAYETQEEAIAAVNANQV